MDDEGIALPLGNSEATITFTQGTQAGEMSPDKMIDADPLTY